MKKKFFLKFAILFLLFLTSCEDPPDGITPVSITTESFGAAGKFTGMATPIAVKSIKFSVTSPDMDDIIREFDIFSGTPTVHKEDITSGPNRVFKAKAFDAFGSLGTLIFEGSTIRDLSGPSLTVVIDMKVVAEVGRIDTMSATFPSVRSGTSATYDSSSKLMYIFGGYDGAGYLSEVFQYDGIDLISLSTASLPSVTRGFTAAAYSKTGTVGSYIFGGAGTGSSVDKIFIYDSGSDNASELTSASLPESVHTSAAYADVDGNIYIFGGSTATGPHNAIYRFNPSTETVTLMTATLPSARDKASAVYHPQTKLIYIFGGEDVDGNALNEILAYDPTTSVLEVMNSVFLTGRVSPSAVYYPITKKIYIFGGLGKKTIASFDGATDTIKPVNAVLTSNKSETSAVYDPVTKKIYIFGGKDAGLYRSDILSFTPE